MNNKGFGVTGIFIFAVFAVLVIWVFYSFVSNVIGEFMPKSHTRNYNNEYSMYTDVEQLSERPIIKEETKREINASSYDEIEKYCEEATENYVKRYYPHINKEDRLYVMVSKLNSYGYLPQLKDVSSDNYCTGYIMVQKNSVIEYNAYIKCGDNYMSNGYLKSLDK